MAQHKIDNQIREKLNAREIQPSAPAWDRLDAMLTVAEEKRSRKSYGWLFIAAGFVLFFSLGLLLFNLENPVDKIDNRSETIVITSDEKELPEVEKKIIDDKIPTQQLVTNHMNSKNNVEKKIVKNESFDFKENVIREEIEITSQKELENQKTINNLEAGLVTVDEKKEIFQVKVDVNTLLSSVEGELDKEFRETTLQRLNRNFKEVKTVVANRNYE